eukprot:TRINITY_DN25588_c0_g1_i1.p1 TRINITY_DN25588_c0_g1~~TRINITY_DN25588_c0_g1_i1.p1  ORF type:complete len:1950 (+),score=472.38 TRINITY_DN25588_c0_g1_i1:531-5852(+)
MAAAEPKALPSGSGPSAGFGIGPGSGTAPVSVLGLAPPPVPTMTPPNGATTLQRPPSMRPPGGKCGGCVAPRLPASGTGSSTVLKEWPQPNTTMIPKVPPPVVPLVNGGLQHPPPPNLGMLLGGPGSGGKGAPPGAQEGGKGGFPFCGAMSTSKASPGTLPATQTAKAPSPCGLSPDVLQLGGATGPRPGLPLLGGGLAGVAGLSRNQPPTLPLGFRMPCGVPGLPPPGGLRGPPLGCMPDPRAAMSTPNMQPPQDRKPSGRAKSADSHFGQSGGGRRDRRGGRQGRDQASSRSAPTPINVSSTVAAATAAAAAALESAAQGTARIPIVGTAPAESVPSGTAPSAPPAAVSSSSSALLPALLAATSPGVRNFTPDLRGLHPPQPLLPQHHRPGPVPLNRLSMGLLGGPPPLGAGLPGAPPLPRGLGPVPLAQTMPGIQGTWPPPPGFSPTALPGGTSTFVLGCGQPAPTGCVGRTDLPGSRPQRRSDLDAVIESHLAAAKEQEEKSRLEMEKDQEREKEKTIEMQLMEPPPPAVVAPPEYYKALEVDKNAKLPEIHESYRRLIIAFNPEKHPDRQMAEEKIRCTNNAYEEMTHPAKRAAYDQMLASMERKRESTRIDVSKIQPRNSLPKEFLLCPLGYSDRFLRNVGGTLKVQSRDDVRGATFAEFFSSAKFTVTWLPEPSSTIGRLRVCDPTAAAPMDEGMTVNFMLDRDEGRKKVQDDRIVLGRETEPRHAHVNVKASPYAYGAFRFEGASWKGQYLAFCTPASLRMTGTVKKKDSADFVCVDVANVNRFMTMEEVFTPVVEAHGGATEYVKLSDLRADMTIRAYFQNSLKSAVWNNKEFDTFFQGHHELWDFDPKRARVRLRPKEQRLGKRLQQAARQNEVAEMVLSSGDELGLIKVDIAVESLTKLGQRLTVSEDELAGDREAVQSAKRRVLEMLPTICYRSCESSGGKLLPAVLRLHRFVARLVVKNEADGKDEESMEGDAAAENKESELATTKAEVLQCFASMATERLTSAPDEVEQELLADLMAMPHLDWSVVAEPINTLLADLCAQPRPAGAFLECLRAAINAGDKAAEVAKALAQRELSVLHLAHGGTAAEVLFVLVEGGILVEEAAKRLKTPVLQRLPLSDVVRLLAGLAERGYGEADDLQAGLQVVNSAPGLAAVPPQQLLRFAIAATKSPAVAELGLGAAAGAAAATLAVWPLDDVAKLLLAVAKSKAAATTPGAQRLFAKVNEAIAPRLPELNAHQLLKMVLAASSVEQCKPLLSAASKQAVARVADLRPAQMVLLTQGMLPLGDEHPAMCELLDTWVDFLGGGDADSLVPSEGSVPSKRRSSQANEADGLSADQLARLAQLLTGAGQSSNSAISVYEAVGKRIARISDSLTDAGYASMEAAFPAEFAVEFPSKASMLNSVKQARENRDTRKTEAEAKEKKERRRSRGRDEDDDEDRRPRKKRGTSADRALPRGSRSRSRSRRRSPSRQERALRARHKERERSCSESMEAEAPPQLSRRGKAREEEDSAEEVGRKGGDRRRAEEPPPKKASTKEKQREKDLDSRREKEKDRERQKEKDRERRKEEKERERREEREEREREKRDMKERKEEREKKAEREREKKEHKKEERKESRKDEKKEEKKEERREEKKDEKHDEPKEEKEEELEKEKTEDREEGVEKDERKDEKEDVKEEKEEKPKSIREKEKVEKKKEESARHRAAKDAVASGGGSAATGGSSRKKDVDRGRRKRCRSSSSSSRGSSSSSSSDHRRRKYRSRSRRRR